MRSLKQPVITNDKGEPIVLNELEQFYADQLQNEANTKWRKFHNALGYEISITTLTTIMKKVSEQTFFELSPADYLPVVVGEGAWSSNLTTYRSFSLADQFETGILNMGGQNSRLASADAGIDSVNILVNNWAKETFWTVIELEQAAKSGNWDVVGAKEEARKKDWDLGIQRVAFLGANGLNGSGGSCLGLLNQPGATVNTSVITSGIATQTISNPANLATISSQLVETFRSNCNRTAWPTHFIIPESDYNKMCAQSSPTYPIKSILQVLEESLQIVTRNKNFKVLPCAYGDEAYNSAVINKQTYALLNYDEKSIRMNVPVDYTNTLANSINNFQFQAAAYGQFTGVQLIRPLELLYFQYT